LPQKWTPGWPTTKTGYCQPVLEAYGAIILTRDLDEAVAITNRFAPEHLELMVKNPKACLAGVRHAGAVFLGQFTPEALGDYLAGPNHILPTGGTARFRLRWESTILSSGPVFCLFPLPPWRGMTYRPNIFAGIEGLDGHGRSLAVRREIKKP